MPAAPAIRTRRYQGILLAAGQGRRFDACGRQNKLLQLLPSGETVVACAARHLQAATDAMLAVVPAAGSVGHHLSLAGYAVTPCAAAASGMAASIVHGVRAAQDAAGWIIALGDMPFVQPATILRLVEALRQGAHIAAPVCAGARGNPVAFGRQHMAALLQLTGDKGARELLLRYPVQEVAVDDPGILRDIDTPSDMARCRA